jgi:hypothetical protein
MGAALFSGDVAGGLTGLRHLRQFPSHVASSLLRTACTTPLRASLFLFQFFGQNSHEPSGSEKGSFCDRTNFWKQLHTLSD